MTRSAGHPATGALQCVSDRRTATKGRDVMGYTVEDDFDPSHWPAVVKQGLEYLESRAYGTASRSGFHDTPNPLPQSLCLIHSEVSEALEAYRDDVLLTYTDGKPEGILSELADIIIRVVDTAHELAPYALAPVLIAKMEYNDTRARNHGRTRL